MALGILYNLRRFLGILNSKAQDRVANGIMIFLAAIVVLVLVVFYVFIGSQSYESFTVNHLSLVTFLTSKDWENSYGTLVLTVGSLTLVVLGLLIAVPLSLGIALFSTEVAPPWLNRILRVVVELFLGIPSVIFGLLGVLIIVPFIAYIFANITGDAFFTTGKGIFAAAVVVAFMVMPTITTISIDSLLAVPRDIRAGSLALGATRWQTMTRTLIPAALPGIMTGVILGAARILGETVAVALVIGGSSQVFPIDFLKNGKLFIGSTSVITTQIFNDILNTSPGAPLYNSLLSLAFLLILISGLLVFASRALISRRVYQ